MSNMFWQKRRENNPDLPGRHGSGWTDTEENEILQMVADGVANEEIARHFQRTMSSIQSRLVHIAHRMYVENVPMVDITIKTRVSEQDLQERIDKERSKKLKKDEKRDAKTERQIATSPKPVILTTPSADITEIKLMLHEILYILRNQSKRQ